MAGLLDDPQGGGGLASLFGLPTAAQGILSAGQAQANAPDLRSALYAALQNPMLGWLGTSNMGGGAARPYGTAPNSLMGFRKNGPNVGFDGSNYPHTQPVTVTLPNGEVFMDEIKGMNQAHALERARRNWDGATIEPAR